MRGPVARVALFAVDDMPKYTTSPKRSDAAVTKLSLESLSRSTEPETFKLPPLLWDEVKRHIRPAEMPTFRRVIGTELIEKNEVINLNNE